MTSQIYVMAIAGNELKVGFDTNPVIELFQVQAATNANVVLMTVTDEMPDGQARALVELIEHLLRPTESPIGVLMQHYGYRHLYQIEQLPEILELIGNSTEIMKSVTDFNRVQTDIIIEAVEARRQSNFYPTETKRVLDEFISTGNAKADELIMKLRKG